MDIPIGNRTHAVLNLFGVEIWITDTVIATWVIMSALIIFAIIVRVKMKKFKDTPSGFQNVVEMLVEAFDNYMKINAGEKLAFLGYWFFTVFVFVILANIVSVLSFGLLRPPTADWSMTLALALVTFMLIQVMAVKFRGLEYFKSFAKPYPAFFLFLPINLLSELARPISLSFRLFGNIIAGVVIMALVYNITPMFVRFIFPAALHLYFDLFAGLLQAYVFVTLGLTFISSAIVAPED
jgi:F-type H+-transporting ATPase subunit a